jgi:hypothetical protein
MRVKFILGSTHNSEKYFITHNAYLTNLDVHSLPLKIYCP